MSTYQIRSAKPADINFIYATWLNSQKYDTALGLSCRKALFFEQYRLVIDTILASEATQVLVAVLPENEDVILGYLVFQTPDTLHYAFVKEAFRKLGIAKQLIEKAYPSFLEKNKNLYFSHSSKYAQPILKKFTNLTFNPFLLYKKES